MAKIVRFPDEGEQSEAAEKAIEYLIQIGILPEDESHELESLILDVIQDYFEAQEENEEGIKPGWIVASYPLEIEGHRYWLTDEERETVEKIKQKFPNNKGAWEYEVLASIRTNTLKPRLV